MHMHQVRYFLALCEQGSFVRAARHCGVAQPSLTRAIKLLEEELGAALFERDRNGARLTELGGLVRNDFAQIEQSATDAKRKAVNFQTTRSIAPHRRKAMEAFMRIRHVAAVAAVILLGLGVKQFWLERSPAAALPTNATINTLQMHQQVGRDLPAQEIRDLTFVKSDSD
jgi:molybdenum-dependent DNA-binding transcriptional regulator ModE